MAPPPRSGEPVWLLNSRGPGHGNGDVAGVARCGEDISRAIVTTLIACAVHQIPLCAKCFQQQSQAYGRDRQRSCDGPNETAAGSEERGRRPPDSNECGAFTNGTEGLSSARQSATTAAGSRHMSMQRPRPAMTAATYVRSTKDSEP